MRLTITRQLRAAGAIATLGLAACSGSGTSPQGVTAAKLSSDVLEMSVGTANIFGDAPGAGATTGLNVAVSYRQPSGALHPGDSAVLVSSPTLSLPTALTIAANTTPDGSFSTIAAGPATGETTSLTSTAQTGSNATTFGTSGGAFGLGLEPFNYTEGGVPFTDVPYAVPLFDAIASAGDPNEFIPWGGPPAFDPNGDKLGTRDGQTFADGVIGVSEGLDVFEGVAPAVGSYGLSVAVPASTGTVTQSTTASISSSALLPAISPAVPLLDGSGGGTFSYVLPAGVTEAYVQITDFGPDTETVSDTVAQPAGCNTASLTVPVYYTFEVTSSGTVTLADSTGPGTPAAPTPSICTAAQNAAATSTNTAPTTDPDDYTVQTIGFDYPAFEASYPNSSGKPSPTLAGANGQSDITISSAGQHFTAIAAGSVKRAMQMRAKLLKSKQQLHRR